MNDKALTREVAYRRMATIRVFEEEVIRLSHDGIVAGSVHPCFGQEAIPVGTAAALEERDRVVATYRGHGWALALGSDMTETMAEILHREGGLNGGRAGSALLSDPSTGFLGENSIVGAGIPIAAGVALAASHQGSGRVVAASIGDGAMNQGAVTEGMIFAAAKSLPLIVICENNNWSEMTPTASMVRNPDLAERGTGLGVASWIVDGCDPFAVQDAVAQAADMCRRGEGPVLLECKTIRLKGHYNRDIEHYRPKEDRDDAAQADPLLRMRAELTGPDCEAADREVAIRIEDVVTQALSGLQPDPGNATTSLYGPEPALESVGEPGDVTELTYQRAVNAALRDELEARPDVLVYGEDVGVAGGIFGVTRGLQKQFGAKRVFDTPISEAAILGSGIGAAIEGMRPVVEIMWADFVLVALDQIVNQAANVRYVNRSRLTAPITIRMQQGVTPGSCAQHSQSLEAFFAHVPGLKVGLPATPQDAYDMLRAAIADPDPTIVIEARALYQQSAEVVTGTVRQRCQGAVLRREGSDAVVVTWGRMVHEALASAEMLANDGIDVAVLDIRWLRPLDTDMLDRIVRQSSGRVLVVHEAHEFGGFGAEVAAGLAQRNFDRLTAPVARLGAKASRIAAAPVLQDAILPTVATITEATRDLIHGSNGTVDTGAKVTEPSLKSEAQV